MKKKSIYSIQRATFQKAIFLLLFLPALMMSQSTLVRWFNSNLQPTVMQNSITAQPVSGVVHQEYWSQEAFYITHNTISSSAAPDPLKFIQFTVTASAGYKINLTNFSFSARKHGGDDVQKFTVKYSRKADFSDAQTLLAETVSNLAYQAFSPNFPANTVVGSGETMYVRIFVYNTYNNFHLLHNEAGNLGPALSGNVTADIATVPLAVDDRSGTTKNKEVTIDVLANDVYSIGHPVTAVSFVAAPQNGVAVVNSDKKIVYTPAMGFTGYDLFYYTITNSAGVSNTAKVELQVIDGSATVTERWNRSDFMPVNYISGITGSALQPHGGVTISNFDSYWVNNKKHQAFRIEQMPTLTDLNGALVPTKFIQFSVTSTLQDELLLVKHFNMRYNAEGPGNFTIRYSKNADFSSGVKTLVDHYRYSHQDNGWSDLNAEFTEDAFLYPAETLYVRIYFYNTGYSSAKFYINYGYPDTPNVLAGPTLTGIKSEIYAGSCTSTAVWGGSSWSETPSIRKKARIDADYNSAVHGGFEACSLEVTNGLLTISEGTAVKLTNQLDVRPSGSVVVANGANLIQVNDSAAPNSGNIKVLTNIKISEGRAQYNYLGSPVTFAPGHSLKTIYPGISFVTYHNEANNLFYSSSGANIPGRGLAVKEPTVAAIPATATTVTATYVGVPQNGVINYALANSNTSTSTHLGFNLLGNPYASNLDLKALYKLNKDKVAQDAPVPFSSSFYLWDNTVNTIYVQQGSSYKGQAYAVYNALAGTNGTGTPAAGSGSKPQSSKIPSNVMKVGQGFMVKALLKNSTFVFNNSVRTAESCPIEFLGKTASQTEDDRYWLTLTTPTDMATSLAVVYFEEGNAALGAEDSESGGSDDELFSIVNGKNVSINGKGSFSNTDAVELGTRHYSAGVHTISILKSEGVFANGQHIYLKDRQTGAITNLSQNSYSFAANAGDSTGRFEIIYKPEVVLATDNAVKQEVAVYKDGNNFVVRSKHDRISSLQLYDAVGRLVYTAKPNAGTAEISKESLAAGVYILRIMHADQVTVKKIIN
ncbi:hypothetical protein FIC_01953 [Flavobacteriaceae bacterium 3519-10]|nr:hypothetical protein FIC_01953 [Flavobacteriaceae bacterium 3519-10]